MNPKKSLNKKLADTGTALIAVLLCLMAVRIFSQNIVQRKEAIAYPLEDGIECYDPFVQQFDALMKGQANIDFEADPGLAELENVYDYKERTQSGIYYLWDRAYYDGKFYSYFGLAPVLTVYMPYYWLHGCLPGSGTVMTVFAVIAAIFMPISVCLWVKKFAPNVPHWVKIFAGPALFWGSLILLIARGYTPFYYVAFVSALAFLSAFMCFALAAYSSDEKPLRYILWVLCGVSYGLLFHARVLTAFAAAFLVVPGLWFFIIGREREEAGKKKLVPILSELACLGIPVIIAIAGAMYFNSIRFSGPFDFGSNYNLTVADVSTYKLSSDDIQYAIYHYFFCAPAKSEVYPYITFSYTRFSDYGHYVYKDAGLGLFPVSRISAMMLLSPAVIFSQRFSARRRIITAGALACVIIIPIMDFCLGGIIYRYLGDFSLVAAFFGVLTTISLADEFSSYLKEKCTTRPFVIGHRVFEYVLWAAVAVFFVYTISVSLRAFLINDNGNIMEYSEEYAAKLAELLPYKPFEAAS